MKGTKTRYEHLCWGKNAILMFAKEKIARIAYYMCVRVAVNVSIAYTRRSTKWKML